MNIIEAIQAANNSPIARKAWHRDFAIIPTDDIELCICVDKSNKTVPRWNPSRKDLVADDWEVVAEYAFASRKEQQA
ncbi:DUF2829 domain-containing protein [Aerococcaceae bacterium zg-ZJ1578]|uniref:Thoeris anti-defense Tad2 family protein n=1 Tax=Aerococcaceae bacterium zg-252 TaxID=2796928 RepID=UPI001A32E228|nr:DUF2829 domain-containing protein [Aerococcaceae bacterium zg-1578]